MELKGEQERIEVIQGSAEYSGFFFSPHFFQDTHQLIRDVFGWK